MNKRAPEDQFDGYLPCTPYRECADGRKVYISGVFLRAELDPVAKGRPLLLRARMN